MESINLFERIRNFYPEKNTWQDVIIDTRVVSGYDITTHITTVQGHYGFWISLEEKEILSLHSQSKRTNLKLYVSSEKPRGRHDSSMPHFGNIFIMYTWRKKQRKQRFDLTEKESSLPLFVCLNRERTKFLDDIYVVLALI